MWKMNKVECKEILDFIRYNYNTNVDNNLFNVWFDELQQYDKNDVMSRLKEMVGYEIYQLKPPTLMALVKDVPKTQQKLDWGKGVVFCNICGKAFQVPNVKVQGALDELHKHEDKCRSMNYIIKQAKKYKDKDISRKELWDLTDDEFNALYDRTL